MYERIITLERDFDSHLSHPRVTVQGYLAIPAAAKRWSEAVWTAAEAEGPVALSRAQAVHGLDVARRPIFVCGAHRSGTTLVRDLLDGHPALAVLPSEGTFLTSSVRALRRQAAGRWLELIACEWLRRLANPIHQAPYWSLGRSSEEHSPYVLFARCLMAWWPIARQHVGATASSWPLAAVALAYAQCTNHLEDGSSLRQWAEKSPTNERFLRRLRTEFPRGHFIHIVRHPLAVLASRAQETRNAGESSLPMRRILRDLGRSYAIAGRHSRRGSSDRYLLLRYEDLLATPVQSMARVAAFLGIEPLPILLEPTVAGLPAASNSSFRKDAPPGRIEPGSARPRAEILSLSARERARAVLGDAAQQLGYELGPGSKRRYLRRAADRLFRRQGI